MSCRGRLGLFLVLGLLASACAWPMDRSGANRAGNNPFEQSIGVANVGDLVPSYTAALGTHVTASPVVLFDVVYIGDQAGTFYAFSSIGEAGCGGAPKTCEPLWTASVENAEEGVDVAAAIGNGVVYVVAGGLLYAFDAAGATNCSGVPKTCDPLWTASTGGGMGSPLVVGDVVYIGASDGLHAFDSRGEEGCSGAPRTCQPLWTAPMALDASAPALAGGVVYVSAQGMRLYAFDAAGETGCAGTPRSCEPLWWADLSDCQLTVCDPTPPAVEGERLFVGSDEGDERGPGGGRLFVLAADGGDDCADPVRGCRPLWEAWTDTEYGAPSVADGFVYLNGYRFSNETFESSSRLQAWDVDGPGCNGCWSWAATLVNAVRGSTSVANGVVYLVEAAGKVSAYDATGTVGCSGAPVQCQPLWETELEASVFSSPTIVNGRVYVAARGALHVFALPAYA